MLYTWFVIMWSITIADLFVTRVGFVMRKKAPLLIIACRYFSAWGRVFTRAGLFASGSGLNLTKISGLIRA